jgi:hypothetical protein
MVHIMKCIKPQGYILEKKIVVFNFKVFFFKKKNLGAFGPHGASHPHFGQGGGLATSKPAGLGVVRPPQA